MLNALFINIQLSNDVGRSFKTGTYIETSNKTRRKKMNSKIV